MTYRDLVIYEELHRFRRDQLSGEPIALELPLPMPYWPEPQGDCERGSDADESPDVVIIDMNDYLDL